MTFPFLWCHHLLVICFQAKLLQLHIFCWRFIPKWNLLSFHVTDVARACTVNCRQVGNLFNFLLIAQQNYRMSTGVSRNRWLRIATANSFSR